MRRREPAWRILSGEFNATRVVLRSDGKMEPNYVLSPMGAKINRVFVIGKVVGMDDLGAESRSFYRIRLSDPTGLFYLAVGEFQPAALGAIKKIEIPSYIAVVGKVKTYEPENGGIYLSIRPEFIYPSTVEMRDRWLLDTAMSLKSRMEAMIEALQMENPTEDHLKALGYSSLVSSGIIKAIECYDELQIDDYQVMLKDALQSIADNNASNSDIHRPADINNSHNETTEARYSPERLAKRAEKQRIDIKEVEKKILGIIGGTSKSKKLGVNWNELLSEVKKKGIERESAEVVVRELMEKGIVYEPMIGILKLI